MLARDLAEAGTGASCQIAADLRARFVCAADELSRGLFDTQSGAVAVDHPHVRAVAVEPNEFVGALSQACVIVTGHAHIRFEPRKAASSARETFWNQRASNHPTHDTRWRASRRLARRVTLIALRGSRATMTLSPRVPKVVCAGRLPH